MLLLVREVFRVVPRGLHLLSLRFRNTKSMADLTTCREDESRHAGSFKGYAFSRLQRKRSSHARHREHLLRLHTTGRCPLYRSSTRLNTKVNYWHIGELRQKEQEDPLLELVDGTDNPGAIRVINKLYGHKTTQAKQLLDELSRRPSPAELSLIGR